MMEQGLPYEAPEKRQEVGLRTRSLRGPKAFLNWPMTSVFYSKDAFLS